TVTPGVLRSPEAIAEIVKDGWLWTGDLGWKDRDGFLFLAWRAKDVLKIGGHRVHPSEIELRLASHPDVVEAAVVGLADAAGVEAAVAFVVRRPHSTVSEVDLRRFCRADLPVYKVPSAVWF